MPYIPRAVAYTYHVTAAASARRVNLVTVILPVTNGTVVQLRDDIDGICFDPPRPSALAIIISLTVSSAKYSSLWLLAYK